MKIKIMGTPIGGLCHNTTQFVDQVEAIGHALYGRINGELVSITYFELQKIELEAHVFEKKS